MYITVPQENKTEEVLVMVDPTLQGKQFLKAVHFKEQVLKAVIFSRYFTPLRNRVITWSLTSQRYITI